MQVKEKTDKLEFIKIKTFADSSDTIKKMKRSPTEWEKLFANDLSDKGLASIIHKEHLQHNSKKTSSTIFKWTNDPNRRFSK